MDCDFCRADTVVKEYGCEDFVTTIVGSRTDKSIGAWMACADCARIIDMRDLDRLVDRAAKAIHVRMEADGHKIGAQEAVVTDIMLRGLYQAFFEHRTDAGKPV